MTTVDDTLPLNSFKILTVLNILLLTSLWFSETVLEVLFHECLSWLLAWMSGIVSKHFWLFLSNKNIKMCPYPPCSLDLAEYNFCFFPKVKMAIKWSKFSVYSEQKDSDSTATKDTQWKRTSSTASESGNNIGISVFEKKEVFYGILMTICLLL